MSLATPLFLRKLSLNQFKNYSEASFEFSPSLNFIVGKNGVGKTNLLDAIYYLSLTKSAITATDHQNIRHQEQFFLIDGEFYLNAIHQQVKCWVSLQEGKKFFFNQVAYNKLSEHVGRLPVVLAAPNDTDLIRKGSEERRKFFDNLLCQIDAGYLQVLMEYNQVLKNRNALLKQFAEKNIFDKTLLESFDERLLIRGEKIFKSRQQLMQGFNEVFQNKYAQLSDNKEEVSLRYDSDYHHSPDFKKDFQEAVFKDRQAERTTLGIHKDDYVFELAGYPLKSVASQGQQKSFVVSLKITMFEIIRLATNKAPLLLLDDIFDKLDPERASNLLKTVYGQGQVFITDADKHRATRMMEDNPLEHGSIIEIEPS